MGRRPQTPQAEALPQSWRRPGAPVPRDLHRVGILLQHESATDPEIGVWVLRDQRATEHVIRCFSDPTDDPTAPHCETWKMGATREASRHVSAIVKLASALRMRDVLDGRKVGAPFEIFATRQDTDFSALVISPRRERRAPVVAILLTRKALSAMACGACRVCVGSPPELVGRKDAQRIAMVTTTAAWIVAVVAWATGHAWVAVPSTVLALLGTALHFLTRWRR